MREEKRVTGYRRLRVAKKGFTLVEILVATTILVIAMASIYVSFKGGVTAWTKGTARMERYLNARAALDMMSREIGAALVAASMQYDISFVGVNAGTADILYIVCPLDYDTSQYNYELSKIAYNYDSMNRTIDRRIKRDPSLRDVTVPEGSSFDDMVLNVSSLNLEYYHGGGWYDEWESADGNFMPGTRDPSSHTTAYLGDGQNNLPEAVRITITIQDELQQEGPQDFSTIVYIPTSR